MLVGKKLCAKLKSTSRRGGGGEVAILCFRSSRYSTTGGNAFPKKFSKNSKKICKKYSKNFQKIFKKISKNIQKIFKNIQKNFQKYSENFPKFLKIFFRKLHEMHYFSIFQKNLKKP